MLPLCCPVREVEVVPRVKSLVKTGRQFWRKKSEPLQFQNTYQGFHPSGKPAKSPSLWKSKLASSCCFLPLKCFAGNNLRPKSLWIMMDEGWCHLAMGSKCRSSGNAIPIFLAYSKSSDKDKNLGSNVWITLFCMEIRSICVIVCNWWFRDLSRNAQSLYDVSTSHLFRSARFSRRKPLWRRSAPRRLARGLLHPGRLPSSCLQPHPSTNWGWEAHQACLPARVFSAFQFLLLLLLHPLRRQFH